jgi:endonuclease/exonuclease/phosphatase family metal-dependent hydrolase
LKDNNVYQCDEGHQLPDLGNDRAKPEQFVPVLRESDADLIALQELGDKQSQAINDELAEEFPHQVMYPGGFAGKAVLSRYLIKANEQLHLSTVRPDLQARIDIDGLDLTFIVAHPPPPRPYWRGLRFDYQTWQQIVALANLAVNQPPAVLLGDFNLADWWGEYAYLRSTGLKDAYAEAGVDRGHTLPKRIGPWKRMLSLNRLLSSLPLLPLLRVDYITCERAWIGEDTGSDHLPVMAKLAIEPAKD